MNAIAHKTSLSFFFFFACYSLSSAQPAYYLSYGDQTYKNLVAADNSQANGTLIQMGDRNPGSDADDDRSLWHYNSTSHQFSSKANPDKCLSKKSGQASGAQIYLWDCKAPGTAESTLQQWVLEEGRIKWLDNKNFCLSLKDYNFDHGNEAILAECTTVGTYQKWKLQEKGQVLAADGTLHKIPSPGETYLDVSIPNPCPYTFLYLQARGGDGGFRSVKNIATKNEVTKAKGGQGAAISGWFKIGTEKNELKPGSNIRLVIGRAGESARNKGANVSSGGGGGTGILYERPEVKQSDNFYYPWKMLLVAGGGGGAQADCCAVHNDGKPGEIGEDGGMGEFGLQGRDGWANSNKKKAETPDGRGYRADKDPETDASGYAANADGAGFKIKGGFVTPTGGKVTADFDGGFGFGGGGYSGGGHNYYRGGWGGGSYASYFYASLGINKMKNTNTSDPVNGYVQYQFSNHLPVKVARGQTFNKGQQILTKDQFKLTWQNDGNLVLYADKNALWASGTNGKGADRLSFQADGNLVIYAGNKVLWAAASSDNQNDGKGGKYLMLLPGGNVSIVNDKGASLWHTDISED